MWEFPNIRGLLLGGPCNKRDSILFGSCSFRDHGRAQQGRLRLEESRLGDGVGASLISKIMVPCS